MALITTWCKKCSSAAEVVDRYDYVPVVRAEGGGGDDDDDDTDYDYAPAA